MPEHDLTSPPNDDDVVLARPTIVARPVTTDAASRAVLATLSRLAAAWDLVLIVFVALFLPFGIEIALAFADPTTIPTTLPSKEEMTLDKLFNAALVAGLLVYLILRRRLRPDEFGVRYSAVPRQLAWGVAGVMATYAWLIVSVVIVLTCITFLPAVENDVMQRVDVIDQMPVQSVWWTLALLIPVAIHEEVLFRGLLLTYLRRLTSRWWVAVLASSLLFALLHFVQGWLAVFQVFGLSVVFSLVFIRSRSLLAVVVAHFSFDFIQFQFARVVQWINAHGAGLDALRNMQS